MNWKSRSLGAATAASVLAMAGMVSSASGQCTAYSVATLSGGTLATGGVSIGNFADDGTTAIPGGLPFAFNFEGTAYPAGTTLGACSNGFLLFGSTAISTYSNQCPLPSSTMGSTKSMMVFWDDQDTRAAAPNGIYTSTTGVAPNRVFHIVWQNHFYPYTSGGATNYEIALYEGSTQFDYIYGTMSGAGSASVGCQGSLTNFTSVQCNSASTIAAGTIFRFTCPTLPTPPTGTGAANGGFGKFDSGSTVQLNFVVSPGSNPATTGHGVTVNTSGISPTATTTLFDDGLHNDGAAGDLNFGGTVVSSLATPAAAYSLPVAITSADGRTGTGTIACTSVLSGSAAPTCPPAYLGATSFTNLVSDTGAGGATNSVKLFSFVGAANPVATVHFSGRAIQENTGTYRSEARFSLTPPGGSAILIQSDSATATYVSSDLADYAQAMTGSPSSAGVWRLETYESYDDGGVGSIDSIWTSLCASYEALVSPSVTGQTSSGSVGDAVTVKATVGAIPGHPITSVTATMDSINGSALALPLFDDGNPLHGDAIAGDGIYSNSYTILAGTAVAPYTIPVTAVDDQPASGTGNSTINVIAPLPLSATLAISPNSGFVGATFTATATVTPGTGPASSGIAVSLDASGINGGTVTLYDDGTHGDLVAGNNVFTNNAVTVGTGATDGDHTLTANVTDAQARSASPTANFHVGYCAASTLNTQLCTNTTYEYLSNVTCGAINDTEACPGPHSPYTDNHLTMAASFPSGTTSAPFAVTIGNYWNADTVRVFVDWDNNGAFNLAGEDNLITSGPDAGSGAASMTYTGNIAVPAAQPNGDYRMRVWLYFQATDDPCLTGASFGHVKDYTFTLAPVAPPTGSCCTVNECNITTQAACTGTWTLNGVCTGSGSCALHCGSADFNCDGDVGTDSDIEAFFSCLGGSCPALPCISNADFNGDGDTGTDADIEAFFRVLGGGAC